MTVGNASLLPTLHALIHHNVSGAGSQNRFNARMGLNRMRASDLQLAVSAMIERSYTEQAN
jgi:hypothetical protein